jgi:hypothetical protein
MSEVSTSVLGAGVGGLRQGVVGHSEWSGACGAERGGRDVAPQPLPPERDPAHGVH